MHLGLRALDAEPGRQHAQGGIEIAARRLGVARMQPQGAEPRPHQCRRDRVAAREPRVQALAIADRALQLPGLERQRECEPERARRLERAAAREPTLGGCERTLDGGREPTRVGVGARGELAHGGRPAGAGRHPGGEPIVGEHRERTVMLLLSCGVLEAADGLARCAGGRERGERASSLPAAGVSERGSLERACALAHRQLAGRDVAQHVQEQRVEPRHRAGIVHEQAAPADEPHQRASTRLAEQRGERLRVEVIERAREQQVAALGYGERREFALGERAPRGLAAAAAAHGAGRGAQSRGPTGLAFRDGATLGRRHALAREQSLDLVLVECELPPPQLALAEAREAAHGPQRFPARGEYETHARGAALDQAREPGRGGARAGQFVRVVDHHQHGARTLRQFVQERRGQQPAVALELAARREARERARAEGRRQPRAGGEQTAKQLRRVAVRGRGGDPQRRAARAPLREHRGLAPARRGHERGQFPLARKRSHEPRPGQESGVGPLHGPQSTPRPVAASGGRVRPL